MADRGVRQTVTRSKLTVGNGFCRRLGGGRTLPLGSILGEGFWSPPRNHEQAHECHSL